jgi:hypothetical protein
VTEATVWNWCKAIVGVERKDWLPVLAPRRKGGGKTAEIPEELWQLFKSDWLRLSQPPVAASYNVVKRQAKKMGVELPSVKAFQRRIAREIDPYVVILMREGADALERHVPSIRRTVDDIQVMEWLNIDGHVFDVQVQHPDTKKPMRPTLVALQDIRSSKILAWRVGVSESAGTVRLVFADLIRNWGIPSDIILDNGRGFAAKWLTGGALTRYRFKILPEDPKGLLVDLGVNIHWATPFHGQPSRSSAPGATCATTSPRPPKWTAPIPAIRRSTSRPTGAAAPLPGTNSAPSSIARLPSTTRARAEPAAIIAGAALTRSLPKAGHRRRSRSRRGSNCATACWQWSASAATARTAKSACSATATGRWNAARSRANM